MAGARTANSELPLVAEEMGLEVVLVQKHYPSPNIVLYFDNYFTSLALLEFLAKEYTESWNSTTQIAFQIANFLLLAGNKKVIKKERGFSVEYVTNMDGIDVSNLYGKTAKL